MNSAVRVTLLISLIFATCCNSSRSLIANAQQGDDRALKERVKASEDACVLTLRTINTAQVTYRGGNETKGFARTLRELGPKGEGMLEPVITSGKKRGYRFRLTPQRTSSDKPVEHYIVTAWPMKRLVKNQRSFFTDETGVIRFTTEDRLATSADPPLDPPSH
jgi:hypothetical protein